MLLSIIRKSFDSFNSKRCVSQSTLSVVSCITKYSWRWNVYFAAVYHWLSFLVMNDNSEEAKIKTQIWHILTLISKKYIYSFGFCYLCFILFIIKLFSREDIILNIPSVFSCKVSPFVWSHWSFNLLDVKCPYKLFQLHVLYSKEIGQVSAFVIWTSNANLYLTVLIQKNWMSNYYFLPNI